MSNEFEKPNRLDKLEEKLYSKTQDVNQKNRRNLKPIEYAVPSDWQSEHSGTKDSDLFEDNTPKINWFFRFFIVAFLFFLGALGFAGYKLYFDSGIKADNIDILVTSPLSVGAGEVFDFESLIQNKNQLPIKYVDIEVLFPDGTRSVENISEDYKTSKETIESIDVGQIIKRNYSALLFGEETEKKEITITLSYQVDGVTSLLKKEKKFEVSLESTPIRLTITNVSEITSGQEVSFNVELVSNSTQTLKNVMVQAVYPFGFSLKNSSIAPEVDKKTWIIQSIQPKESINLKVNGVIEGQNKDEKFFKFSVGLADEKKIQPQIVFSTKGVSIALARPFLELDLAIDQDNSDVISVDAERSKSGTISFKNNTEFPIRNATISLNMNGLVLHKELVQINGGFYQSLNNTVVWDYTTSDNLILIPVGSSGSVSFNFGGLGISSGKFILNPELDFKINVKGNRNVEGNVSETIENSIVKKIRFNTQVEMNTYSQFYSPVFANFGPLPPKVEQKTSYTGFVELKNTSNSVSNAIVTMRVPNYVKYEGAFSPNTEEVSYDPVTRIITWNVKNIYQKTGYQDSQSKTLAVQVSIIPSISQDGSTPVLLENIKFNGIDDFTKKDIEIESSPISTAINDAKDYYSSQVSR